MTSLDQSSPPSKPRSSSPRNNSSNSPVENGAKKKNRPPKIRAPKIKKSQKLKRPGKNIYLKRKPGGESPRSARKKGTGNNNSRTKSNKQHIYDPNTLVRFRYQTKVDKQAHAMIKARRNMYAMDDNMYSNPNAKVHNTRRSTPKLDKLLGKKMVSRLLNAGRVANELNRPIPDLDQHRHHFTNNVTPHTWFKKRNTGIVRDSMVRESIVRDSIAREQPPKQNFNDKKMINSLGFELAYLRSRAANDQRKIENMSVEIMRLKGDLFNKDEQIEQLKAMINILHQYSDNVDQKKIEPNANFGFEEKVDTTVVDPPTSDLTPSGEKSVPPDTEFTCNAETEAVAMQDVSTSKSSTCQDKDEGHTECDESERGTSDLKVPDEEVIYPWNFPGNAQDTPKTSTQSNNNSVSMEDIEEGIGDLGVTTASSNESDPQTPSNTQSSVKNFHSSSPPKTEKTEKQKYLSFGDYFVENDKAEKGLLPGDYGNIRISHHSGHVAQKSHSDTMRKNIHANDTRWPMTKLQYRHSPPPFVHGIANPSIVHARNNSSHPNFATNKLPMHPVFPNPKQHFNPQQTHPQPAQILIPISKLQPYLQTRQDQNNQHSQVFFPNESLPFSKAHYNRNTHRVYHNNGHQMHHESFLSPQYMSHATASYPHNFPGGRYFQQ